MENSMTNDDRLNAIDELAAVRAVFSTGDAANLSRRLEARSELDPNLEQEARLVAAEADESLGQYRSPHTRQAALLAARIALGIQNPSQEQGEQ